MFTIITFMKNNQSRLNCLIFTTIKARMNEYFSILFVKITPVDTNINRC